MPGLDPVRSGRTPNAIARPPQPPPTATSGNTRELNPAAVRDDATAAMAALRRPAARPRLSPDRAMTMIANAFERSQREAHAYRTVRSALAANPPLMQALAAIAFDTLLDGLRVRVGYWDGGGLTEQIAVHHEAQEVRNYDVALGQRLGL